jgi:hypothetical protein
VPEDGVCNLHHDLRRSLVQDRVDDRVHLLLVLVEECVGRVRCKHKRGKALVQLGEFTGGVKGDDDAVGMLAFAVGRILRTLTLVCARSPDMSVD